MRGLRLWWILRSARRLIHRGRLDAAELMLAEGLSRSPKCGALLELYALCSHNSGRYGDALTRWQVFLLEAPGSPFALAAVAANQRELNRLEEAKVTIIAALAKNPDHIQVLAEAGRIADRRHEHEEALSLWERLFDTPNAPLDWRRSRDRDLVLLGRLDDAEIAIAEATTRDPHHQGHFANLAMLRLAQGRWNEAEEIARALRAQQPNDLGALELLGQALHGAALAAAEVGGGLSVPAKIERVEDDATRSLLLHFQSIGEDCEFGLVQRRFGAEPLGLLRWNWMALPKLFDALNARFEGLGDEVQTKLVVAEMGEYYVHDLRYGLRMHTFAYRHQVDSDVLKPKMLARLRYLRDKIVEDLSAAEKVFVYKASRLDLGAMRKLHCALSSFGPVRLLCVVPLDRNAGSASAPAGEIMQLDEGLYIGFLTRLGRCGGEWRILYDEWVALCAKTVVLSKSRIFSD